MAAVASVFKSAGQGDRRALFILIGVGAGGFLSFFLLVGVAWAAWKTLAAPKRAIADHSVAKTKSDKRIANYLDPAKPPKVSETATKLPKSTATGDKPVQPSAATVREEEWVRRTLQGAYDRQGVKDPKWDASARVVLGMAGKRWDLSFGTSAQEADELEAAHRQVTQARCNDPLVHYAAGRFYGGRYNHANVAQAMEKSKYHVVHQCFAYLRAAEFLVPARPGANPNLDAARKHLAEAVKDNDVPLRIRLDLCQRLQDGYMRALKDRKPAFDAVNAELEKAVPNSSLQLTFQGRFYMNYAWDARGNGWANTVKEEGWRLFKERLEKAQTSLEKAWELDHSNADAATSSITVAMGLGSARPQMESWFQRAVAADPDYYNAYKAKLIYLQPKWHGSTADALAFARECQRTGNWKARLPFIMLLAHTELANSHQEGGPKAYFQLPSVWPDLQNLFESYLKLFPDDRYHRSQFALVACHCRQWGMADRQFRLLGEQGDRKVFYEPGSYDRFRKEAAEKAPPP